MEPEALRGGEVIAQQNRETSMTDPITVERSIHVQKLNASNREYVFDDNYMIIWAADGLRTISVDFDEFPDDRNSIYFISPGKRVRLEFHSPPRGWVLCFTRDFFRNRDFDDLIIKDVDIYASLGAIPKIVLSPKIGDRVHTLAEMIDEFIGSQIPNRESAIHALLKALLVYCDSKCNIRVTHNSNNTQVNIVSRFKHKVSRHYLRVHQVSEYAEMMGISSKYLNQAVKNVLGVTAKSIIQEQLVIQARRDLKFSDQSVKEIAFNLGFTDQFHFSRFFKRNTGCSPSGFRNL